MFQIVEFPSQGALLRGRYYSNPDKTKLSPVVIMAHGFSATINGMVADRFAEVLHQSGFAVLLYDHRNFGISGGEPRQEINIWIQARGYVDAINYITTLPEIDSNRIAIWGDSMSGGEVVLVAAMDPRVKAVIAQVPGLGNQPPPADPDGSLFAELRETFFQTDLSKQPHTIQGPLPIVSPNQQFFPSLMSPLTAFRWFIEYGGRFDTRWENYGTHVTYENLPFHSGVCAPQISVPVLMIVAFYDEMPGANADVARMVFDLIPNTKQLFEMDGGHFGLLHYPGDLFNQASAAQRDFLLHNL
jgi:pimeloyl-ACP methyl ester carboxylesterase